MADEAQTTVVERFGSIGAAISAAERMAVLFLVEDDDNSPEWATQYMQKAREERHLGDCAKARWWEQGPMTCLACVYDEFMERAWRDLGVPHAR